MRGSVGALSGAQVNVILPLVRGSWLLGVLAACTASFVAPASALAPGWETYYPLHQPVSVALPEAWSVGALPSGAAFYATNSQTGGSLTVYANANQPATESAYLAHVAKEARQTYLVTDPKAVVRSHSVRLPAGRVLDVVAQLTERVGSHTYRLRDESYNVLHDGIGYSFVYQSLISAGAVDLPVFQRSAQTIRFTS